MSDDQSSIGPALVGNISVDSLDNDSSQRLQQQQQHLQTSRSEAPLELTFDANSSPMAVVDTHHTGGDISSFDHDTDVSVGPTVREAEEYADQMTSEILEQVQAVTEIKQEADSEPQSKQEPQEQQQNEERSQQQQHEQAQLQKQRDDEEEEEKAEDFGERKVEGVKEELSEVQQRQLESHEEPLQEEHSPQRDDEGISLIKLNDSNSNNNELFHQTFKTAANTSQLADDKSIMEFTKNYSDDLMGSSDGQQRSAGGPDLADFELPPYSGSSSSGSEQAAAPTKHSPVKQRKSSNSMATQASASSSYSSGSGVASPPDLSAVKNLLISTYSNVAHIFHWKRPIESGVVFTIGLILITALTFFSIISVVAYTALGCILTSGLIRIYKASMKALNRSPETPLDHIWEKVLSVDVSMSPERLHELVETSHANLNASLVYFKQVLLVEDKIATTKSFLFLYSLTYIGSWFNGLTLITIIYLALFSVPKLYENNKTKIDECLNLATKQISSAVDSVTGKFGCSSKKQS